MRVDPDARIQFYALMFRRRAPFFCVFDFSVVWLWLLMRALDDY